MNAVIAMSACKAVEKDIETLTHGLDFSVLHALDCYVLLTKQQ